MRTESDVRLMRDRLKFHNDAIVKQIKNLGPKDPEIGGLMSLFNSNGQIISALDWVLGANTISVSR